MSLSRTVSEINGENRKNFNPRVFNTPSEGFPLELGNDAIWVNNKIMGLPDVKNV